EERSMGSGADALAIAIVEGSTSGVQGSRFGVGIHRNTTTASVMALISLARRLEVSLPEPADTKPN
ncbi:MAG TPA: alpha-isopropylmalate synthase regulatory domain-containing protein, partial [Limnobacter sp.]